MQIYGPVHVHGAQSVGSPHTSTSAAAPQSAPSAHGADEVQISDAAQLLDKINELPEIRAEKVDAIRQAIADGTYETEEKLQVALERLADEIL